MTRSGHEVGDIEADAAEYDASTGRYEVTYNPDGDVEIAIALSLALETIGSEYDDVPLLYEFIDVDVFQQLFESERPTAIEASFGYDGWTITVDTDGHASIEPPRPPPERGED
jgi:hypothetical protein